MLDGVGDMFAHFLHRVRVNQRADGDAVIRAVADFQLGDGGFQFGAKASYTPSCTRKRLVQTQVWPALRYFEATAPATAASRSASSNTINGALPPSSMLVFLMVGAHWPAAARRLRCCR